MQSPFHGPDRAVQRLGYLGAGIATHLNDTTPGDSDITAAGATVRTVVITAREDLQIAREARALLVTRPDQATQP